VRPDTVFYNFSIGKGAMAALVHQQVDVGAFGDDIPVAELWPEFARHGKQAVTVRQVLDHAAGVPGIPPDMTVDTLADWPRMVAAMQVAEPSRPAARCRPGPSPGCTSRCSRSRRGAADQRGPAPGRVEAVLLRPDEVCGDESAWGLGYALGFPWDECARTAFGMAGAGGS
jgi:hypothetical protein